MKAANSGPVDAGVAAPTGAADERPVIGTDTAPPAYVPESTGAPKKFCALRISYDEPGTRTPERSTLTVERSCQL